jgi:endonuclease-8
MPEGDALHRAARRLRALEGEVVAAEAPHPRAAALRVAERIDGRRLERVDAVGKNLLLTFEGDLVVRSHLRMRGRWRVQPAGSRLVGKPWLILRGRELEAVLWNGPTLELGDAALARLGPDIMREPPDLDTMVARLRAAHPGREIGEALLDQRLVAGIGNMWKAEALHRAGVSPWARLGDLSDDALRRILVEAAHAMRALRGVRLVYRRAGLPCRRCGTRIEARPQGELVRTAYWCPSCQLPPPAPRRMPQAGTTEGAA